MSKPVNPDSEARRPAPDARKERWRKHRQARRAEFVDAAIRALGKHGPDVGMDDIAAEAGVTKPVLYRHFTDKADLYLAVGHRGTELLFQRLVPALNTETAPRPRIKQSLTAFFSVIDEFPNVYRFITGRHLPAESDVVHEDKEMIAAALATLLGDYMRAFNMDSGGAEPWAHGIVGLVQNTADWWLDRQSMSREAVVDYLTQIIWAAIDGILRDAGATVDPDAPFELPGEAHLHAVPEPAETERETTRSSGGASA
ncbi:TetR family transcriptional regulator [Tamaricihabitans halophyticus]|uniref:TetR family transcriptional regulator n=2 Tax=Tamaricihabitans halophyticus TaxID=1262583 RepID=A0A4R2QIT4_9PSEU|nr:TetR/AcrR family transcriptional regulator [Tamaricihabitans halophyticus]TCP49272.1 TetR family transcriptional regulator [Tamaricihabitans halophyticus]